MLLKIVVTVKGLRTLIILEWPVVNRLLYKGLLYDVSEKLLLNTGRTNRGRG